MDEIPDCIYFGGGENFPLKVCSDVQKLSNSIKNMQITRLRTLWGIEPGENLEIWANWFPSLKNQGYDGIEVDIHGLDAERDFSRLRDICNEVGLKISVLAHSSWFMYEGPRPNGLKSDHHLQNYREILKSIRPLRPVSVNFQSGEDLWEIEESVRFYKGTLEIDQELEYSGRVFHETHRNRSLFTPYSAKAILEAVPQLRITADFSHWMVCLERLLDIGEGDRATMNAIIPHVYHIHARIGTTQASQTPEPTHPAFEQERLCLERLWTQVLEFRFNEKTANIAFVPEYGPFPYHPIGSAKTHGEVADEEGQRLYDLFNDFISRLESSAGK